jgi:hypothetical protein
MESPGENMKIMIFYLLSEEILRINIIQEKTTIKDIENSINEINHKMKDYFFKIASEDFDINQVNSKFSNSYLWVK